MAALDYKVLSISQPKIALRSMEKGFFEKDKSETYKNIPAPSESTGLIAPFVKINELVINGSAIVSFSVSQKGFLPELTMTFIDHDKLFTSLRAPKYDPILSVYLKSTSPKLKSFRGDFLITSVKPIHGQVTMYSISAELYVPNLYNNVSKAYPKMLSFDVLKKIAEELNLGFATNEEKPNDSMTWLSPNITYKGLIQHIVKHAYKDESSYFTCFIDRYYMLNYINIEKIMQASDLDETFVGLNQQTAGQMLSNYSNQSDTDEDSLVRPAIVTNHPNMKSDDAFIINYALDSEHGQVLKDDSIKKRIMWYDHHDQQKVLSFYQEPITQESKKKDEEYQLPILEDFKKNEVVKWVGIDYHNAHKNYKFARLLNSHNLKELDKNVVRVTTRGINASLTRGQKVLAMIFIDVNQQMSANMHSKEVAGDLSKTTYLDKYTSGQYYVRDIVYRYVPNKNNQIDRYVTEFWLARKEWLPTENIA